MPPLTRDDLLGLAAELEEVALRRFLLEGQDLWLVEEGSVDVFAVMLEGADPVGSRRHLFRVDAGAPLFPIGRSTRGYGLLAVPTGGSRVARLGQERLRERAGQSLMAGEVAQLVDRWVETVYRGLTREMAPARSGELVPGRVAQLTGGHTARVTDRVSWIRHRLGESRLFNVDDLGLNGGFTPIAAEGWITAQSDGELEVVDTDALIGTTDVWQGLDRLHGLVLRWVEIVTDESDRAALVRLRRRAGASRATLRDACVRLAAAMTPDVARGSLLHGPAPSAVDAGERQEEEFLAACRMVGDRLGLSIRPPRRGGGQVASRDPLAAIAAASRIRVRQVRLRDRWWTQDSGPLLAFVAEDGRPVALLPDQDGYRIRDPRDHADRAVTRPIAATLSPMAYTMFRPFQDGVLRAKDVVRFGLRGCNRDLAVGLTMATLASLLGLLTPIATGMIFNTIIPGALRSQLLQLTLALLVSAAATAAFHFVRAVAMLRVEARMGGAVQSAVWDRLLGLPLPFFRQFTAGDLAVRAMGIDAMRQALTGATITALMGGIFSVFNLGLLFKYSRTLAWWGLGLIAIGLFVTTFTLFLQLRHQRTIAAMQSKLSGVVLQFLTSISKLRVAGAEVHAFGKWAAGFSNQRRVQFRVRTIGNLLTAFNTVFPLTAYLVIFALATPLLVGPQALRTGDFLAFMSAFALALSGTISASGALLSTLAVVPIYEQAKPILGARAEVTDDKSDPGSISGDLEIQHVSFRYGADTPLVLRDLTLRIRPGEFLALVGPSGSGKSTVLRLLLGFEQPESGAIYYDGQDLAGLDVGALRRQIGVVLQNGRLMPGDILTNIIGSAALTFDDAWEAARLAGFDEDVKAMPMGMHTVISEGGGTLSGGQRQRLMIARAIVHRPRLVLFDEATSALDNRTQGIVSASLERLQATRVVVAHRLSTIQNADRIVVVNAGRAVQTGTYQELLGRPGPFVELARRQLL